MQKYRDKLNKLDQEMLDLFIERLDIIVEIKTYKEVNKLAILDQKREDEIINKGLLKIDNPEYKQYYKNFMQLLLDISKDLQSK